MTGPWLASTLRPCQSRPQLTPGAVPACIPAARHVAPAVIVDAALYNAIMMPANIFAPPWNAARPPRPTLYELVVEDEAPNSDASAGIRAGMTRIDVLLHLRHSDPIPALPAPWKVADPITFRHPAQPLDPRFPVAVAFDVDVTGAPVGSVHLLVAALHSKADQVVFDGSEPRTLVLRSRHVALRSRRNPLTPHLEEPMCCIPRHATIA